MNENYLIIADDFTGSNDTGVQLKKNQIDVDLLLFPTDEKVEHSVVLDTESRNLSKEEAYRKVKDMTEDLLKKNDFSIVYKKIDSTLRGNVAKEIQAIMEVYQAEIVVVAPAFPKINRTTEEGVHYLNQVPLMQTEIAEDPLTPIWTDNICTLLAEEMDDTIKNITTDVLASLDKLPDEKFQVFDVKEDQDLNKIKTLCLKDPRKILYVGSAGLAEYLFEKAELPSLSVVGSISEVSLEQMAYAKEKGFEVIKIEINDLVNENCVAKYSKMISQQLEKKKDTIVTVTRKKEDYHATIKMFKALGVEDKAEISGIIKRILADITAHVLGKQKLSRLFLTGGDTAIEIINKVEGKGCQIQKELSTGIVESSLVGGPYEGLTIVTKAGAFGKKESLYLSLKQ